MRKHVAIVKASLLSMSVAILSLMLVNDSLADIGAFSGAHPKVDAKALFLANCAFCHAKDGKGMPKMRDKGVPNFTDAKWQKSRTDAQIIESVKNSKGKLMPAWKNKLNDEQIAALAEFVRSFGKKN